jgi:organic radical activating enzyme
MNKEILDQLKTKQIRLEVLLAAHCNLKCRYCARFSCIADKEFYEFDQIVKDLRTLKKNKLNVTCLSLSGGEPLLHPRIIDICKTIRLLFPKVAISIFTNGKDIRHMSEQFWRTLVICDVTILYTKYGCSNIDYDKLVNLCKEHHVKHNNVVEVAKESIDHTRSRMAANRLNPDGSEKFFLRNKLNCYKDCPTLYNGYIYQCGTIPFIHVLNEKYNKQFEVVDTDKLPVEQATTDNYIEFMKQGTPFCKYCNCSPSEWHPWENSNFCEDDWIYYEPENTNSDTEATEA